MTDIRQSHPLMKKTDAAAERGVVTVVATENRTCDDDDDVDLSAKSKSMTPVTLTAGIASDRRSPLAAMSTRRISLNANDHSISKHFASVFFNKHSTDDVHILQSTDVNSQQHVFRPIIIGNMLNVIIKFAKVAVSS